ncbi:hypothetical protein H4Q26_012642 [Puccinia striiformis f. sp. tritici PST-130]|uniref:Uncharacterized protein n=1 Tax=Puccinia striiformis f. sp. tritici PST-78 TaxID=1165861 RepID=A0A0L0VW42_9BASI|nr:hypothetical protein H4Q26_012642 [Puccinia striiformis f. sp. tritici PST-130]KNF03230.1 hypothetical protein PSTG_03494 [Puccinia striiformis f. sp. tritici PST-78]
MVPPNGALIFDTSNRADNKDLKANIKPITIKVNETNIIGKGSMRQAFNAEVKTICSDGSAIITNRVTKIQYHKKYQTIAHHATDTLMYEAMSGLLLPNSKIVRYAVVVIGSCTSDPNQVYFLEAAVDGP